MGVMDLRGRWLSKAIDMLWQPVLTTPAALMLGGRFLGPRAYPDRPGACPPVNNCAMWSHIVVLGTPFFNAGVVQIQKSMPTKALEPCRGFGSASL
jgi:hypothetical protein